MSMAAGCTLVLLLKCANKNLQSLNPKDYIIKNENNRYFVMKGGNKVSCTKEVNKYNKNN